MKISLFLVVAFLLIFALIFLARWLFSFLINRAYKNYDSLKKAVKNKIRPDKKDYIKEDEELMKVKAQLPRAHSAVKAESKMRTMSSNYELIESDQQLQDNKELAEVKIVDLVQPVGFWTSMILGQKLTYLVSAAQILNNRSQKGFWVSMIEAKDRAAGREKGRGL
jgi:hypothetical protein